MRVFSFLSNVDCWCVALFIVYFSISWFKWWLFCVSGLNIVYYILLYDNYIS